mmetsp:Transcript_28411/g.53219  ORF Transcript_28411/g.53219 Transcript_28411/m.53219 type:complete len:145 (-) Transcript_28411:215-649(-)
MDLSGLADIAGNFEPHVDSTAAKILSKINEDVDDGPDKPDLNLKPLPDVSKVFARPDQNAINASVQRIWKRVPALLEKCAKKRRGKTLGGTMGKGAAKVHKAVSNTKRTAERTVERVAGKKATNAAKGVVQGATNMVSKFSPFG